MATYQILPSPGGNADTTYSYFDADGNGLVTGRFSAATFAGDGVYTDTTFLETPAADTVPSSLAVKTFVDYEIANLTGGGGGTTMASTTLDDPTFTGAIQNPGGTDSAVLFSGDTGATDANSAAIMENSDTKLATCKTIKNYVERQIADVVDSAPDTLNTLNELAAALSDSPDTITALTTVVGTKQPIDGTSFHVLDTSGGTAQFSVNSSGDTVISGTTTMVAASASDTLTCGKTSGTGLAVTKDATIGGTLAVTGITTMASALDVNAAADVFGTLTCSATSGTGLQVDSNANVTGTTTTGSLSVTNGIGAAGNKFAVAESTGNITTDGTITSGAVTTTGVTSTSLSTFSGGNGTSIPALTATGYANFTSGLAVGGSTQYQGKGLAVLTDAYFGAAFINIDSGGIRGAQTLGVTDPGTVTIEDVVFSAGDITDVSGFTATGTITAGTVTDGTMTITGGAITGATTINATGDITVGGDLDLDGSLELAGGSGTISGGYKFKTQPGSTAFFGGSVSFLSGIKGNGSSAAVNLINGTYMPLGKQFTDGLLKIASGSINDAVNITATGAVLADSLTDGVMTATAGALTGVTNITATGTITGVTDITATGTITGNVTGDVTGNVTGDLSGAVTGNVTGDLTGAVTGNVTGNVTGAVTGNVTGDLTGAVTGDVTGNVIGDLSGAVTGSTITASGNVTLDASVNNLNFIVKSSTNNVLIADTNANVVQVSNLVATHSITNYSDRRIKTDIAPTQLEAVEILRDLKCYEFKRTDIAENNYTPIGFIAQEVQDILPYHVEETAAPHCKEFDTLLSIRTTDFVPLLVKAVQELSDKVIDLEKRLAAKNM